MIALVGKTCSGKTTVADILEKDWKMPRVRTYTTRPPRDGETDEYMFVNQEEFDELYQHGFFLEITKYNVANGDTWFYGTPRAVFEACIGYGNTIILNPEGIRTIGEKHPEYFDNLIVCYLLVTEEEQLRRLMTRGDNIDEAKRRIEADREDFRDISALCDRFYNTDKLTPDEIAKCIVDDLNYILCGIRGSGS